MSCFSSAFLRKNKWKFNENVTDDVLPLGVFEISVNFV